ncbi:hypothetical protein OIU14_07485 [Thalassobacter stenotrophicus]|uniref:hypothetical protein n=1 Tax=Thalassobacter stenotrophicus TaxID=266809 RepID=UPI0022A90EDE|nr:hypothetical protein [Thalassobacter stenotrophicus]UYP69555.1 hypothetical protein OIU14_07485 [Thalassobacter stenotrophicus]
MTAKRYVLAAVMLLSAPMPLLAETLDQRIKSCIDGSLADNAADELVVDMLALKMTFSSFVENNAAACFTKLTQSPSQFVNGTGIVTDPDAIAKANQHAEELGRQEQQRLLQEAQAEAELEKLVEVTKAERRSLKCSTLELLETTDLLVLEFERLLASTRNRTANETMTECFAWAAEDRRAAITNVVCNGVFKDIGLPEDIENPEALEILIQGLSATSAKRTYDTLLEGIAATEALLTERSERQLILAQLEAERRRMLKRDNADTDICDQRWERWLARD